MKALITGATSGIGRCIARELHRKGWKLILSGRNEEELAALKKEFGDSTETFRAELSDREQVMELYRFCSGKNVDMLVNNAGFGIFGRFDEIPLEDELKLIDVDITAVHILMKLFLREFKKRRRGYILNVASSAGFLTGPLLASYYAAKNYVVRLTFAAAEELRRDGFRDIKITVLCPGPVDTNFNRRAGVEFSVKPVTPEYVADYALRKLFAGKLIAIPGLMVRAGVFASRFLPHKLLSAVTYEIQKSKLKNSGNSRR